MRSFLAALALMTGVMASAAVAQPLRTDTGAASGSTSLISAVRSGPFMCTMQYDPVCGVRHGRQRTYGNACMARAQGARIVHRSECRRRR